MKIRFSACGNEGWYHAIVDAPEGSDVQCSILPRGENRLKFWEEKTGIILPRGHVVIWEAIEENQHARH